jgi:hypothetical protein
MASPANRKEWVIRPYKINSLVLRPFFPIFDAGGLCFFPPFLRCIEMMREEFFFN